MEDILLYIKNRLRIMGYTEYFSFEPKNITVNAGEMVQLSYISQFLYLINVESVLQTDPNILFSVESDTTDTTNEDFFVNGLPFNIKELTGNIEMHNLNSADAITFITLEVIPETLTNTLKK